MSKQKEKFKLETTYRPFTNYYKYEIIGVFYKKKQAERILKKINKIVLEKKK